MSKTIYDSNDIEVTLEGDKVVVYYTTDGVALHKTYPVSDKELVLEHLDDITDDMRKVLE